MTVFEDRLDIDWQPGVVEQGRRPEWIAISASERCLGY